VVFLECDLQLVVGAVIWSVPDGTPLRLEEKDPGLPCVRDYGLDVAGSGSVASTASTPTPAPELGCSRSRSWR